MERLRQLLGAERSVKAISERLHFVAASIGAPVTGAVLVTCADGAEREAAEAFQSGFVQYMMPPLKFAQRAPYRLSNLGGRYDWGAIRIAEQHLALPVTRETFKLIVVKVNAHVAAPQAHGGTFGVLQRFGSPSPCCGSLAALIDGVTGPFTDQLAEAFNSEGKPRLAVLCDEKRVPAPLRLFYAAVISARLQARAALLDIQDATPQTPTVYLVTACVTLNKSRPDTEILCGYYLADTRVTPMKVTYMGLGDDPEAFTLRVKNDQLLLEDPNVGSERLGRNHRALVLEEWQARQPAPALVKDERLERVRRDVQQNKHRQHQHAKALLKTLLPVVAEINPVAGAVLLFANGAGHIHHVYKMHKLAREMEGSREAREILAEIHDKVDQLPPDRAEAMIELLMREYKA